MCLRHSLGGGGGSAKEDLVGCQRPKRLKLRIRANTLRFKVSVRVLSDEDGGGRGPEDEIPRGCLPGDEVSVLLCPLAIGEEDMVDEVGPIMMKTCWRAYDLKNQMRMSILSNRRCTMRLTLFHEMRPFLSPKLSTDECQHDPADSD